MTCELCQDAPTDGYLCARCATVTVRRVESLPGLHAALAAWLTPSRAPVGARSAPGAEAKLPLAADTVDLRTDIRARLESWLAAVHDARGWGAPHLSGTEAGRVLRAARSLAAAMDWVAAAFPGAGDLALEVREMERSARTVVSPPNPTVRAGECAAVLPDGGEVCGAALRASPGSSVIRCRWCGTEYGPRQWVALATGEWADSA